MQKTPPQRGFLEERMMGFEPTTFCIASEGLLFLGRPALRLQDWPGGRSSTARLVIRFRLVYA